MRIFVQLRQLRSHCVCVPESFPLFLEEDCGPGRFGIVLVVRGRSSILNRRSVMRDNQSSFLQSPSDNRRRLW